MGKLGDIFRTHGSEYRRRFEDRMSLDQLRAIDAIENCHTPAAGSALWRCKSCGHGHFTYQGCGNRHCPSCGRTSAAEWLRKQCALLLPGVTYHLVTFTVPDQLRRHIRSHPRELLDLLMRTASSTLLDLCANPKWGLPCHRRHAESCSVYAKTRVSLLKPRHGNSSSSFSRAANPPPLSGKHITA